MERNIPNFLTDKNKIIQFLLFVAIFALIFITIYKPFGSIRWLENTSFNVFFLYTSALVILGFIILSLSRLILYKLQTRKILSLKHYIIWISIEIILISIACSILGYSMSVEEKKNFIIIFERTILYTISILFLPYLISWLYFSLKEKEQALKNINTQNTTIEDPNGQVLLNFYDKKGNLCLSVKQDNLLYIESYDNYISIYYIDNDKITKFLIRNSLSNIEKTYSQYKLQRCHRSFLVNMDKIKVIRKQKDGFKIELDFENAQIIPISKTYYENFAR